jgi:putative ABC transport system permease protein
MSAFRVTKLNTALALKSSGPTTSASRAERRLLSGVAAVQTAITVALLVGAGLLCRTVEKMAKVRLGYETEHIVAMEVTSMQLGNFFSFHEQALARVAALPGVKQVAFAWGVPLTGNRWVSAVRIGPDAGSQKIKDIPRIGTRSVTPEYFDLIGQPIVSGRNFPRTHSSETNRIVMPLVAIVNEALAKRYFSGISPIGRRFKMLGREDKPIEIIGVVANARTDAVVTNAEPEIYFCLWEALPFTKHLLVRTASDSGSLMREVQGELRRIEPTVSIANIKTLSQIREESVAVQTFTRRLLVGFSIVALILTSVGIYGVLSLSVASRQREIAIRIAVGATHRSVLRLVLGEGLRLVAIGLVMGGALSLALAHVLKSFLYGVPAIDPPTYAGVVSLFSAVALIACWVPARRASRIHPLQALHAE